MRKNKFGFTFVELLVVVAIIIIMTWFWVMSFFKNQSESLFYQEVQSINQVISNYDFNIWKTITDYEINFYEKKDFYVVYENNLYKNYTQLVSFNSNTWTISNNSNTTWSYTLKIYENNKLKTTQILSATWSFVYDFSWQANYTIEWDVNWTTLNKISINKFWKNNDFWQYSSINLIKIENNSNTYSWAKLSNNISKDKKLFVNSLPVVDFNLYFEKSWLEKSLTIKK